MARLLSNSAAKAENWDVHLILLDREPAAYAVPDWVTVHQLDCRHSLVRSLISVARTLMKLQPTVTLSFLSRSNFANVLSGRLCGARVVISERINSTSHFGTSMPGRISKLLTTLFYPRADKVIAVSSGIRDDLTHNYRVSLDKITVIPNPVDRDLALQMSRQDPHEELPGPVVVAMGRLVPLKNFALLLEAYAKLDGPGTLLILGDGPMKQSLVAQARRLGIAQRVRMPGFVANPFAYIARADCFVLPSDGEGFPNGLVEAMSMGVPVVSTNCHSGPSEILDGAEVLRIEAPYEARYGLLVPTGDAPAMAQAIRKALQSDNNCALRAKAVEGARRYDLQTAVARYWSIIECNHSPAGG